MNLINKFRQRAAGIHQEFLTNISDPEYVNGLEEQTNTGRGCQVKESSKFMENLDMDYEGKQILKGIADELNNPATQKAIRERLAPKPAPKPAQKPTAEDVAAREAMLQYAREATEMKQMEDEFAKKYGIRFV